jgi:hypothetical protein
MKTQSHLCATCGWECNGSCAYCDGIALIAARHPRKPWLKRFIEWLRNPFRRARLNEDALDEIEIEIRPPWEVHNEYRASLGLDPLPSLMASRKCECGKSFITIEVFDHHQECCQVHNQGTGRRSNV